MPTTHTSCHSPVTQPYHPGRDGSDWGILLGNLQRPLYLVFKKVDSSHPHPTAFLLNSFPDEDIWPRAEAGVQVSYLAPPCSFPTTAAQSPTETSMCAPRSCVTVPIPSTDTKDRLVATGQEEKLPGRHLLLFVFPKVGPLRVF